MTYRRRNSLRAKGYAYGDVGIYFVTINTWDGLPLFGEVVDGVMWPNDVGQIVIAHWHAIPTYYTHVALDEFQLMPNHLHGIIVLNERTDKNEICANQNHDVPTRYQSSARQLESGSLSAIIGSFKAGVTRTMNRVMDHDNQIRIWHRNYYDTIVQNDDDLVNIRNYIRHNPKQYKNRAP
jgi:putative transposase